MSAISGYKIHWQAPSQDLPEMFDIQMTDAKTQRVFADLIEEQECENLPFVVAYHPAYNFMDARSLDHSSSSEDRGNSGPSTPTRFLALFPYEKEFHYIGSNVEEGSKKKFVDLFLKTLSFSNSINSTLKLIYFRYQFGNGVVEDSDRAKKIMNMMKFHKEAIELRQSREKQPRDSAAIFKEVMTFFSDPEEHRNLFGAFYGLSAGSFYKPAYFPLFLCFHYGIGVLKNGEDADRWLKAALKFGDPRAIAWNQAKEFFFMDAKSDFELCFDMHSAAEEAIQNYIPLPDSFIPKREENN